MNSHVFLLIGNDERYIGTAREVLEDDDAAVHEVAQAVRNGVEELLFNAADNDTTEIFIQIR